MAEGTHKHHPKYIKIKIKEITKYRNINLAQLNHTKI
jgi:hypothetical protein